MTARQIKWKTYWNFIKLTKRPPTRAMRKIIKSIANMAESEFEILINPPPPILVRDEDGEYVATGTEAAAERAWLLDEREDDEKKAKARAYAEANAREDATLTEAELHWKYDGPKGL